MIECIEWQGWRDRQGYGRRWQRRGGVSQTILAHREAWEAANGPISDGLCVLHTCDNPPCVNPAHLFLGTRADNMADRNAKGRGRWARGVRNPSSVLTPDAIIEANAMHCAGATWRAIGDRFGVHHATVMRAVKGETWREPWPDPAEPAKAGGAL